MHLLSRISQKIARSPGDPEVVKTGPSSKSALDTAAIALGWFSIGLGLAEVLAPRKMAALTGLEGREGLIRAYGMRELAAGRLCLSVNKPQGVWSRVAGDAVDLATLAYAFGSAEQPQRRRAEIALAVVAAVTVVDVLAARSLTASRSRSRARPRRFADRSGFPQGVQQARGAARADRGNGSTGEGAFTGSSIPIRETDPEARPPH